MKIYSPSDITDLLDIKESTLRKYCLLLESVGITFKRNNRGQRWYTDNDVILLRKFVTFKDNGDMTLKECADAVFLWHKGGDVTLPQTVTSIAGERYNSDMNELKDMMDKQSDLMYGLIERLDQQQKHIDEQQKYIDDRLKERDRILMQSINEIMESKKQITSAEEKKGFFARLFGK